MTAPKLHQLAFEEVFALQSHIPLAPAPFIFSSGITLARDNVLMVPQLMQSSMFSVYFFQLSK